MAENQKPANLRLAGLGKSGEERASEVIRKSQKNNLCGSCSAFARGKGNMICHNARGQWIPDMRYGECRRLPPKPLMKWDSPSDPVWPVVSERDWCTEFLPVEGAN